MQSIRSVAVRCLAIVAGFFAPVWLANLCKAADEAIPAVIQAQQAREKSMALAARATIAVFGLDGGGGGSGVIITPDGYALTNFHVTSACGDHMRIGLSDGTMVDAVIVGIDATGDVSLIKLIGRNDFPTAELADSDTVRVGQWCFAVGNPFGLATNLEPTVSLGLVSGVGRYQYPAGTILEYADCIQTDAAINPGNSGGPLFNMDAQVIGINGRCSFEKRGRVNVGVGYAISINQIKSFLGMLRSGRLVDHATLGATVATEDTGKVLISNIINSSDAYRRGLRYGDEVLTFAGREVRTTNDFKNILGTLPKDWRVPITIKRGDKEESLLVRLTGVHSEMQLAKLVAGQSPNEGHKPPPRRDGKPAEPNQPGRTEETEEPSNPKDQAPDEKPNGNEGPEDGLDSHPARPDFKTVRKMLVAREGFANYYFNRLEQQQVWLRLQRLGSFASLPPVWKWEGNVAGETTRVEIEMHSSNGRMTLGSRTTEIPFTDALAEIVNRNDDAGLLVGMRAWQQLLADGPEKLGDTVYLGTAPVYPTLEKKLAAVQICDVLQTTWYDTIVRFYVPVTSDELALIEVFGDGARDPVEIYLDQYTDQSGVRWPSRIRLQYGTEPRLILALPKTTFAAQPSQEK